MSNSRISLALLVAVLAACSAGPRPDPVGAAPTPVPEPMKMQEPERDARPTPMEQEAAPSIATSTPVANEPLVAASSPQPAQVPKPVAEPAPRVQAPAEKPASPVVSKPVTPKASSIPAPDSKPDANLPAMDSSAVLSGQLTLSAGSGQSIAAAEMSQATIYYVPDSGAAVVKPGRFRIYTHNKEFEPASMVIPLGSTITFPNQDEILHNVFSVTPRSSFDLGVYGEGKSAEYTFKRAGLVLINCNVHHAMQANVLVVDTPYYTTPDAQGRYRLESLPIGSGKLMAWHPRSSTKEWSISVPSAGSVDLNLVLTKPKVAEHLNKDRKAY